MCGYPNAQDLSPAMPHDEQPINQSERDRWHDEQVHRGDAIRVVAKERFPSLRGRPPPPRHILGHARLADIDTKLEELTMDSRRSPQRIGDAHLADQPTNFQRHGWSTAAAPRFPTPIRSKSSTAPTNHGVRSDDCKCIIHLGKQSADASQYQSVNRDEGRLLGISPAQHIDLLPQHHNLYLKRNSRPQQVDHHPESATLGLMSIRRRD